MASACPAGCSEQSPEDSEDDEVEAALLAALTEQDAQPAKPQRAPDVQEPEEGAYEDLFELMREGWPPDETSGGSCSSSGRDPPVQTCENGSGEACDLRSVSLASSSGAEGEGRPSSGPGEAPTQKRPAECVADLPANPTKHQRLDPQQAALVPGAVDDGALVPERVAKAYCVLDLPLTASAGDVRRKSRQMSRKLHPDKAPLEQRAQAARLFRQLQEAKDTIISWLADRAVPGADESASDSAGFDSGADDQDEFEINRPRDVAFGEAGDVMAEFEDDGSGSDGERQDEKAAGLHAARGDSPNTEKDSDESDEEQEEAALVLSTRGSIRTQDSALVQATSLSHFLAAPSSHRQHTCSECFQNKVPKGEKVCKKCKKELGQLKRCLGIGRRA